MNRRRVHREAPLRWRLGEHDQTTLRGALKLCKRRKLWTGDLHEVMPAGFSAEHRPRERYLTVEELQKLLPQLLPEKTAVVAFIIATAADWSAVGRALRADVAIDGTGCTIRGSKNEYRRNRVVPIATHEQRTLIRYALEHADGEPPKK